MTAPCLHLSSACCVRPASSRTAHTPWKPRHFRKLKPASVSERLTTWNTVGGPDPKSLSFDIPVRLTRPICPANREIRIPGQSRKSRARSVIPARSSGSSERDGFMVARRVDSGEREARFRAGPPPQMWHNAVPGNVACPGSPTKCRATERSADTPDRPDRVIAKGTPDLAGLGRRSNPVMP